jgi:hypothetical protein
LSIVTDYHEIPGIRAEWALTVSPPACTISAYEHPTGKLLTLPLLRSVMRVLLNGLALAKVPRLSPAAFNKHVVAVSMHPFAEPPNCMPMWRHVPNAREARHMPDHSTRGSLPHNHIVAIGRSRAGYRFSMQMPPLEANWRLTLDLSA